jgi:Holliday junction resolvase RusA-like endonuclease
MTQAYYNWRQEAFWLLKTQKREHALAARPVGVSGPYSLAIRVPEKTRGDIDNRIKGTVDALVSCGITPDDKHMRSVSIARADVSELTVEVIPA